MDQKGKKKKMKKIYSDGWHTLGGEEVYIEDGKIQRAVKLDSNGSYVPAQVYRWLGNPYNCWSSDTSLTPAAFLSGLRRGTKAVM